MKIGVNLNEDHPLRRTGLFRVVVGAVLGLAVYIPAFNAFPYEELCVSDAELREVLIGIYSRNIGMILGTCARRFPIHAGRSMDLRRKFQNTYEKQIQENDRATIAVFERTEPRNGEAARDRNSILALQQARKQMESWSEDQCRKSIKGIEGAVVVKDWNIAVGIPVTLVFKQERERIPTCR